MDERAHLILARAKELLVRNDPSSRWIEARDRLDAKTLERQGTFLSLAEHQLLDEGRIESVDQS